jgi:hypothetical protein
MELRLDLREIDGHGGSCGTTGGELVSAKYS